MSQDRTQRLHHFVAWSGETNVSIANRAQVAGSLRVPSPVPAPRPSTPCRNRIIANWLQPNIAPGLPGVTTPTTHGTVTRASCPPPEAPTHPQGLPPNRRGHSESRHAGTNAAPGKNPPPAVNPDWIAHSSAPATKNPKSNPKNPPDPLSQLLAQNLQLAANLESGKFVTPPEVPEWYGNTSTLTTHDCIS
jgi:hypothetical protein